MLPPSERRTRNRSASGVGGGSSAAMSQSPTRLGVFGACIELPRTAPHSRQMASSGSTATRQVGHAAPLADAGAGGALARSSVAVRPASEWALDWRSGGEPSALPAGSSPRRAGCTPGGASRASVGMMSQSRSKRHGLPSGNSPAQTSSCCGRSVWQPGHCFTYSVTICPRAVPPMSAL